jgi:hypothetical protein
VPENPVSPIHKQQLDESCCGFFISFYFFHRRKIAGNVREQGDQIGRIFAYWAIVYFGQFFY